MQNNYLILLDHLNLILSERVAQNDLILFLTPVSDKIEHYRNFLALNSKNIPHMVVLTKTDTVSQTALFNKITEYQAFQDTQVLINNCSS